jgi:hypothetical protein
MRTVTSVQKQLLALVETFLGISQNELFRPYFFGPESTVSYFCCPVSAVRSTCLRKPFPFFLLDPSVAPSADVTVRYAACGTVSAFAPFVRIPAKQATVHFSSLFGTRN